MNASFARKTGPPFRTSTGPPPTAFMIPVHSGRRITRIATVVPTGASSASRCAAVPRATSTAPPAGIGVGPDPVTWVTGPNRSVLGVAGGNGAITAWVVPAAPAGVVGP